MTAPTLAEAPIELAPAPRWTAALAGVLGAGAALVVLELASAFDATGVSVTEAVGNRFIEGFAASLKDVAVRVFGTNDKAALQVGTAIVVLAIGAIVGTCAVRRPNVVFLAFGGFALVGMAASLADPLANGFLAVVACTLAAAVGSFVTLGLVQRWERAYQDGRADPVAGERVARRMVLVNGGVTAAALLFGVAIVRSTRSSLRSAATTVSRKLPLPGSSVPIPTGTLETGPDAVVGISPYVTPTADFYRIDTAFNVPVVDPDTWTLTIGGMVDHELTFTYADLLARELVEVPITMLCVSNEVGGDLVGTARWIGVPLAELLEEAGVQPEAEQVMGRSVDGFTAGFPVEVATDGREALLAIGMNGRSLPAEHGFPARLVVPGIYGYVSATKWISEIRLTTWDEEGFWIPRGWSQLGPIKTSSRIDVPSSGADLVPGAQAVAGVAWAPTRGIARVEVQVDDGSWEEAELGPVASDDTWVQWWYRWDAGPGDHTLRVRATDGDGATQTAEEAPPAPDGATGHHEVSVSVEG